MSGVPGAATRSGAAWTRAALVLVLLVAALGVGLDRIVEPLPPVEPPVVDTGELRTAASVCAVGDGRADTDLTLLVARPGEVGQPPAQIDLEVLDEGSRRPIDVPAVFPGSVVDVAGEDAQATAVRWRGGPASVSREWRTGGQLPDGLVAGPCAEVFGEQAVIPGLTTLGGAEARLRVANPFPSDASFAVAFVGPDGVEEPLALQNVSVASDDVREIVVNDHLPERSDLAAVVTVRSGRVALEGIQVLRAAIGGIDAVSLLAASTAASEVWTLPWLSSREGDASWLWITNLGDRPALIELTFATSSGGVVPNGLAELTVPPGEQRRVDLRGTFPEGSEETSLVVRSDGAPVHVSAAVERTAAVPRDTGFAVQLGAPRADTNWVVSGGATSGRDERLWIVNPGSEAAALELDVFAGRVSRDLGEQGSLRVGPGAAIEVPLSETLGTVQRWAVFVTATEGEVVVSRVGQRPTQAADPDDADPDADADDADADADGDGDGDEADADDEGADETEGSGDGADDADADGEVQGTRLVAVTGTPGVTWRASVDGLVADQQPGLVRQLGTEPPVLRPE